jgi:hypothetical protein
MLDYRCISICKTLSNNVLLVIGLVQWKNDHLKLEVDINAKWTVDFAFWLVTYLADIMRQIEYMHAATDV